MDKKTNKLKNQIKDDSLAIMSFIDIYINIMNITNISNNKAM